MATSSSISPLDTEARLAREAVRYVLADYRRARRREDPYRAAKAVRDGLARYLADRVADGEDIEWGLTGYRAARRVYDEVCRRADVGGSGRKFVDLSRREQFWQTGQIAGAA